jgi:hypothetical protein
MEDALSRGQKPPLPHHINFAQEPAGVKETGKTVALSSGESIKCYVSFHPYQKQDGRWYWFDEIKAESLPYETKGTAETAIERYRSCFLRPKMPRSRSNHGKGWGH